MQVRVPRQLRGHLRQLRERGQRGAARTFIDQRECPCYSQFRIWDWNHRGSGRADMNGRCGRKADASVGRSPIMLPTVDWPFL